MKEEQIARRSFLSRTVAVGAGISLTAIARKGAAFEQHGESESPKASKIDQEALVKEGWVPLFNGKDLTGWEAEGGASWKVKDGMLIGQQGPDYAPGDLFTKKAYADFELLLEYKLRWPANSGVWFRYQAPDKAYQADMLEYEDPECYSGTLYCPGRLFLAMNEDPEIVNREGWNTMRITAKGDHLKIVLNGTTTADVHDDAYATGRIGFQVHPGEQFGDMRLTVRKMLLKEIRE